MKVINFIGSPCSGKSTKSAGLFHMMKSKGMNVELVQEYAKDLTWEQRYNTLENQVYVLGKQYHRMFRLKDKVDYIITDSPLLLSLVYNKHLVSLPNLVLELYNSFDNINLFLPVRSKEKYIVEGRNQTWEESVKIEGNILRMLRDYNIDFKILV